MFCAPGDSGVSGRGSLRRTDAGRFRNAAKPAGDQHPRRKSHVHVARQPGDGAGGGAGQAGPPYWGPDQRVLPPFRQGKATGDRPVHGGEAGQRAGSHSTVGRAAETRRRSRSGAGPDGRDAAALHRVPVRRRACGRRRPDAGARPRGEAQNRPGEAAAAPAPTAAMPQRFIGYLFDDVHVDAADLMRVRAAAERHIETQLKPTDRAAIFTTSGQGALDFTDDRDQLREALARLVPRPIARATFQECPDISYLQADMIVNHEDPDAIAAAATEIVICRHLDPQDYPADAKMARAGAIIEARRVLIMGEQETQVSLAALKDAVRRMSAMPGERILVVVSPGFLTLAEHQPDEYDVIERALRANVLVNVLNARGLYTTNIDASHQVLDTRTERTKQTLLRQSEAQQEALFTEFAADTGGYYFHNNNDLAEGFRRISTTPEVYYLLGFQPQNLKLDGSFHGIKVAVESKAGFTIEARRGYYAPTHLEDAAATARREIEDAVFSREEMSDLPVQMHTQFFKSEER